MLSNGVRTLAAMACLAAIVTGCGRKSEATVPADAATTSVATEQAADTIYLSGYTPINAAARVAMIGSSRSSTEPSMRR